MSIIFIIVPLLIISVWILTFAICRSAALADRRLENLNQFQEPSKRTNFGELPGSREPSEPCLDTNLA